MDLVVAGRLLLAAGAHVDVGGKGYPPGMEYVGQFGLSGVTRDPTNYVMVAGSTRGSSGSHGGVGGAQSRRSRGAGLRHPARRGLEAVEEARAPRQPIRPIQAELGGGVVRITAGTLVLEGTIVADGALQAELTR